MDGEKSLGLITAYANSWDARHVLVWICIGAVIAVGGFTIDKERHEKLMNKLYLKVGVI